MEDNITDIRWLTSSKPMIQLQQTKCTTFALNLVYPQNKLGLVHVRKNLSHALSIRNGLKQGDAWYYLNLALEHGTRKATENRETLEVNGTPGSGEWCRPTVHKHKTPSKNVRTYKKYQYMLLTSKQSTYKEVRSVHVSPGCTRPKQRKLLSPPIRCHTVWQIHLSTM